MPALGGIPANEIDRVTEIIAIGAAAALERATGGVVALREAGTEQLKNTGDSES